MVLAFTRAENGFTAVHSYVPEGSEAEFVRRLKLRIQDLYDRLHGKGSYSFFLTDGFFYPYIAPRQTGYVHDCPWCPVR